MKRSSAVNTIQLLVALAISSASCASTSCTIAFHEVALDAQGTPVIYVYRLKSMVGAAVKWAVRLDGKVVANMNQGAYIALSLAPGPHSVTIGDSTVFWGGGLVNHVLNVTSQAGEEKAAANGTFMAVPNGVYFLRSKGFSVELLPREEAMKDIPEMKYDTGM